MQGSILIVEDDAALRESLNSTLRAMGLSTQTADTGERAMQELKMKSYNVVLLDLNMPGMGGMAACKAIRDLDSAVAIIIVTVRDHHDEKVTALNAGADDYVTKPFHLPELIARIRAALRRRGIDHGEGGRPVSIGEITLDREHHRVLKNDKALHLTPTEFALLEVLMKHAGRPVAHRALLAAVWGPEYGQEREYLRTYINQIRRKVEDNAARPKYILTDNYIGYRFEIPRE